MKARTTLTAAVMAVATGAAVMTMAAPAGAATAPSVSASPHTNLVNGQMVTVTAKGFTHAPKTGATAAECSKAALKSKSISDCDISSATNVPVDSKGDGTAKFKILTGSNYSDANGGKCGGNNACIIVVIDAIPTTQEAAAGISFKGAKLVTKTTVLSKKTVTKGKKLTITAKTTHGSAKLTGTVTFTANGKKLAKVKETKSGRVSIHHRFKKAGKYKIKATYSGSKAYKGSSGTRKITVKK